MIRHTVLIACDGADEAAVDRIVAELRALPPLVPAIAAYTVGRNLGLDGSNADVVVIADFASIDDYRAYGAHPEHVRVVEEHIAPVATGLNRAQFELDG